MANHSPFLKKFLIRTFRFLLGKPRYEVRLLRVYWYFFSRVVRLFGYVLPSTDWEGRKRCFHYSFFKNGRLFSQGSSLTLSESPLFVYRYWYGVVCFPYQYAVIFYLIFRIYLTKSLVLYEGPLWDYCGFSWRSYSPTHILNLIKLTNVLILLGPKNWYVVTYKFISLNFLEKKQNKCSFFVPYMQLNKP